MLSSRTNGKLLADEQCKHSCSNDVTIIAYYKYLCYDTASVLVWRGLRGESRVMWLAAALSRPKRLNDFILKSVFVFFQIKWH